ncbi:membrane protein (plasmid) [Fulvitalea axinellae]|uniref:Membrane protein n=1 Tax=Fulvitalea axinellae TaxID=1182444 RepID=A0AAU9CVL7_9BACT|nr:membrane protein [Fulvitalea axinellae]
MKAKYLLFVLLLLAGTACDDDFLNKPPKDKINSDAVFKDMDLVQANLNEVLGRLPSGHFEGGKGYGRYYMLGSITDEARSKSGWVKSNKVIIKGALSPTLSSHNDTGLGNWNDLYKDIRAVHDLMKGLEDSPLDEEFKNKVLNQARFVRAIKYFDLARRYGDIPLLKEAQDVPDDYADLFVPKSKQSEIYAFVKAELDEIATQLPKLSDTPSGGISRQAAIALNARTMLYAERWAEAAAYADQLIWGDANDGLDLYKPEPATAEEAVANMRELFISLGGNTETILEKNYLEGSRKHSFDYGNWPVRWRGNNGGQTDPTQELVNAFEMQATGLPIDNPASGYNPEDPYKGRDPRFDMAVYHHGSPGPEGVAPRSGEPFIDMEWNKKNEGPGTIKDGNASITGYLVRKFVDPRNGFYPRESFTSWQEFRFAEILLIYAEAENEANGPSAKVYEAINRIRRRAMMPPLKAGLDKEGMRQAIRHERRIELVFESHRWFDLIRWRIARDVLDGYEPMGVKIERREGAPTVAEQEYLFDPSQLKFSYFKVGGRSQVFPESHYLLPIPQSELNKFPELGQNPGYD